jgi:hypothetical protein
MLRVIVTISKHRSLPRSLLLLSSSYLIIIVRPSVLFVRESKAQELAEIKYFSFAPIARKFYLSIHDSGQANLVRAQSLRSPLGIYGSSNKLQRARISSV